MIFPSLYNAPVSWYAMLLADREEVSLEQFDHYTKQTYRNRCRILGANGVIDLVIPIVKEHGSKTLMKDVRIDYDTPWQKIHWRSIFSSYASAPFFEFIEDAYRPFYSKSYKYLVDLNKDLITVTLDQLQVDKRYSFSENYLHTDPEGDLRELIHPKRKFTHPSVHFEPREYQQVFSDRHGFEADLSIIDLLFNEGGNACTILRESVRR